MAKEANISDPNINTEIDKRIYETITEEYYEDMQNYAAPLSEGMTNAEQHPPLGDVDTLVAHMRNMVEEGYTDEQIKQLHPELAALFNRGE